MVIGLPARQKDLCLLCVRTNILQMMAMATWTHGSRSSSFFVGRRTPNAKRVKASLLAEAAGKIEKQRSPRTIGDSSADVLSTQMTPGTLASRRPSPTRKSFRGRGSTSTPVSTTTTAEGERKPCPRRSMDAQYPPTSRFGEHASVTHPALFIR